MIYNPRFRKENDFNENKFKENGKNFNFFKLEKIGKKEKFIALIIYLLLLLLYIYIANPILNPIYKESYFFIIFNILILLIILFLNNLQKIGKLIWGILISSVLIFIIISIYSSPLLNSNKYYDLIGDVKTYNYDEEKPKISNDIIPVVDYDMAHKLGDKVLGKDLGLGSQFDIGEYYLISTKDDIVWVAPLEPQNFFKWFSNKNTIPGYIYVSATNPNDVRLVQDIDGKDINIKYSDKSYFNHKIDRYAYLNNNFTKGLTDYSFEIDDEGNPYWVITTFAPKIGFSGYDVNGLVLVNAQTGETKNYSTDDDTIPSWVDRIYPKSMIFKQLEYYGAYKNGWFNTVTSQKEMIEPTQNLSYVFIDNKAYFYSGMTSVKSDESTVGFIIRDIASKDTSFYKITGSTEAAAQNSAEGKVQQFNYNSSLPILLNIYNTPTYFMTLKDDDGLVKKYAFVSVKNYNIVGIGDSLSQAKKDYYNQLKDNNLVTNDESFNKETDSIIKRINFIDDAFYIKLENDDNIYVADKGISKDLYLSEKNDHVKFTFSNNSDDYKEIINFTNKDL